MGHKARSLALPLTAVLVAGGTAVCGVAQEPTLLPFDAELSIYVGHSGTWNNLGALQQQAAEVEDPVAAFQPLEEVSDELDVWADHQINVPAIPEGWTFFTQAWDLTMGMHVIVRDVQQRLLQVKISNRDTGAWIGTLHARPDGSEVNGSVSVDPEAEAFRLDVIGKDDAKTLFIALANDPAVDDAIVTSLDYQWQPNTGDDHASCPSGVGEPFGDARDVSRKLAGGLEDVVRLSGCAGPTAFTNDTPNPARVTPRYPLLDKAVVEDTTQVPFDAAPKAIRALQDAIAFARRPYEHGSPLLKELEVPPYSKGVGHWTVGVYGDLRAILYSPYRGLRKWKGDAAGVLWVKAMQKRAEGLGQHAPSQAVAAAVAEAWGPEDVKRSQAGPPMAAGEVWCLRSSAPREPAAVALTGITAPVTFELWADLLPPAPGAPGFVGGHGSVAQQGAWTAPPPPNPLPPEVDLTFPSDGPEKGLCTVELPKGYRWKATAALGAGGYSKSEVGPFELADPRTERIECHLEKLVMLRVKTVGHGGKPASAEVDLQQQVQGGGWAPAGKGPTAPDERGNEFWSKGILSPGAYRARARVGTGPWSDWHAFDVAIGILQTETVSVPPR